MCSATVSSATLRMHTQRSYALSIALAPDRKQGVEVVRLIQGEAESIPAPAASFDVVVSTLVLCSVRDPVAVLNEVHRVLRPGGKYCFIEHVSGKF